MKLKIFRRLIALSFIFLFFCCFMSNDVCAYICGGTPCVDTDDIIDKQITSSDIENKAVKGWHINKNSIRGIHVKDGSLTGADISSTTSLNVNSLTTTVNIGIGTDSPQVSLHNNGNFITKGPWVDVRAYASFSDAIDAIGFTEKTLLIPNEQVVSFNKTVPSNVTLWFLQGSKLYIASDKIVTINGHVEAGMYQIFNGSGTVWFGSAQKEVYPEWWGAYNNGTNANSTTMAIQAALDTSKPLQFTAGTYLVDASLNATSRNVLNIKGAGKDKTIIKGGEAGYPILDCIGSLWIDISDIAFQTDCETNIASCGVLIGRKFGDGSAGNHRFSNVKFIGCYTISGVYSLSSEVNYFERCKFADSGAIPSTRIIGYVSSNDPSFLSPNSKFERLGTGVGGNTVTTFVNPVFNMFSIDPDSRA